MPDNYFKQRTVEIPTFQVEPRPLEVPAALQVLAPDTAVTALRHWFDFAIKETTNAGEIKSEIEQRIKYQAAGLFSIDEAACIIAGETGEWPTEARTQIWRAIDDGRIAPVSYKTRAKLRLPITGTNERLALVRTNELANVFEAWPFKPEPQTAPATAGNEMEIKLIQRQQVQNAAILEAIQKMGHDPLRLPKNPNGKPGVKAEVRKALERNPLFTGTTVFKKAWERLSSLGDIEIAKVSP